VGTGGGSRLVQFANKVSEAALGRKILRLLQPERITGFMSHWMTFSGPGDVRAAHADGLPFLVSLGT
jgi:hypothetical protein